MLKRFFGWREPEHSNPMNAHHVIPISTYWPDIEQNIAGLLKDDHAKLHQELDIPMRVFSKMTRDQRKRENGHIVLTESDIEGRADIQRAYLEWVEKLPNFLYDMHEVKLWDLAQFEAEKFKRLTGKDYQIELWDAMENHWTYIDIMKESSKYIYKKLRW